MSYVDSLKSDTYPFTLQGQNEGCNFTHRELYKVIWTKLEGTLTCRHPHKLAYALVEIQNSSGCSLSVKDMCRRQRLQSDLPFPKFGRLSEKRLSMMLTYKFWIGFSDTFIKFRQEKPRIRTKKPNETWLASTSITWPTFLSRDLTCVQLLFPLQNKNCALRSIFAVKYSYTARKQAPCHTNTSLFFGTYLFQIILIISLN